MSSLSRTNELVNALSRLGVGDTIARGNVLTALVQPPPYLVWRGASGSDYEFEMWRIGTSFPIVGGIYMFTHNVTAGWIGDYVGKTRHFGVRIDSDLRSHHCWPRILAAGSTHVGTLIVHDADERARFEADLIAGVHPPCNR